jgi:hypothetical protein
MLMACAVGVHAIGITSVLGDADELREAGAETVAESVAVWAAVHVDAVRAAGR